MNSKVYDIIEDKHDTVSIPVNASCNEAIENGMNIIQGKHNFNYLHA